MKYEYKVEMSEAEYVATLSTLEKFFGGLLSMAASGKAPPPAGKVVVVAEDSDTDEDPEDSDPEEEEAESERYWSDYEPQHVVFDDHYGSDRPEGAHVARGETDDRGVPAPEEAPLPRVAEVRGADLDKGRKAFEKLLRLWLLNFGVVDAEQPDRAEAMRALANSPRSFKVLSYVKAQGGLTHAVHALAPYIVETEDFEAYKKVVLDVAGNMTQVSSILFPDLSDLYEFKDIFRSGDDEEDEDDE